MNLRCSHCGRGNRGLYGGRWTFGEWVTTVVIRCLCGAITERAIVDTDITGSALDPELTPAPGRYLAHDESDIR